MFTRIIIIVLDSVGIGELPDAAEYGDSRANTLSNIARSQGGLFLPTLERFGLGCISPIIGITKISNPKASYGKMAEISVGKDTTSGHWELAGCPLFCKFPVYPNGFPTNLITTFEKYTGKKVLGNIPASGTEIIQQYGDEHCRTGYPIVYTSADSVFQIAAHEKVIPVHELYEICEITRKKVCVGQHAVGRVIARPFIGSTGNFVRTANRHDYSLEPPEHTMLDKLNKSGLSVYGIGKIGDIYAQRGITKSVSSLSNEHGMMLTQQALSQYRQAGIIMTNLVEFDSLYGHRNDPHGYKQALQKFDSQLNLLLAHVADDDLLIITADHGCDPTLNGTDHTREYVPLLVYRNNSSGKNLGTRSTFADVSATVLENFNLPKLKFGTSFLNVIRGENN